VRRVGGFVKELFGLGGGLCESLGGAVGVRLRRSGIGGLRVV